MIHARSFVESFMKAIVEHMFRVQKFLRPGNAPVEEQQAVIRKLQELVPPPILAHYLRLIQNGGNGVAMVRHGVCGECHIRVPSGTQAALAQPTDLHLCESCGCYLLVSADEAPQQVKPQAVVVARKPARKRAAAATLAAAG
jgi:predicted  nucleic acid-binding Zn-ribbon protein